MQIGFVGGARYIWRQLTSMRTAILLLLLLGFAAIPGSLVPQRTSAPMKVQEYFTFGVTNGSYIIKNVGISTIFLN